MPMAMAVKLIPGSLGGAPDLANTANVSVRGARILSRQPRQANELMLLALPGGEASARARVVYCQPLANAEYAIGLEFCETSGSRIFDPRSL